MRLLAEGRTLDEIARIRGRQRSTIVSMVSDLVERGEVKFQPGWVDQEKQARIEDACARLGLGKLTPLKDVLPPEITFEEIRLVVARLRRQQSNSQAEGISFVTLGCGFRVATQEFFRSLLNKVVGGSQARTVCEFPREDPLAPLKLHRFQPQTGPFTAHHIHLFCRMNDFSRSDAALGGRASLRPPP